MMRKRRCDRTHVIYQLILGSECYIGVTAKTHSTVLRSVKVRVNKHLYRSRTEHKNWTLCKAIRTHGIEAFRAVVLEVIRGKAPAHQRERELIRQLKPSLNSDVR